MYNTLHVFPHNESLSAKDVNASERGLSLAASGYHTPKRTHSSPLLFPFSGSLVSAPANQSPCQADHGEE